MKPLLYISGPYSAPSQIEREQNILKAKERYIRAMRSGYWWAVCPHTHTAGMEIHLPEWSHAEWISYDIGMLRMCDAIWISPSASLHLSHGTYLELAWAILANMPIMINTEVVTYNYVYDSSGLIDGKIPMSSWLNAAEITGAILEINELVRRGKVDDPGLYKGSVLR